MGTYLGIELGSTRIKAVVTDCEYNPVSSGDYVWASKYENGVWTYELDEAIKGVKAALNGADVGEVKAVGISGMMHGYLAFDKDWNLLAPFRTWQNTITAKAAAELTKLFGFNVPQRWSIAHLYQAILNREEHIGEIAHITTLAGYIHYRLTGVNAVGICEASGIFPIDSEKLCYDGVMLEKFDRLIKDLGLSLNIYDVLPRVLVAGEKAGTLTEDGAELIDNMLPVGVVFAPPEGDGGTGMTATNAVATGTGNISAGTSVFSMVVLDKLLDNVYEEIDMVTTPTGKPVAMVHCNNCTVDSNAWISVLGDTAKLMGADFSTGDIYKKLYEISLVGDPDCGGVTVCNYTAGEGITHIDSGRPLVARTPDAKFTLANFMRATLYSTMATLKMGMDILARENVSIKSLTGHGGLFKTPVVGQKYMAAACNTPITVTKTAGEGGPYGMSLLAAYCFEKNGETLEDFLNNKVFKDAKSTTLYPEKCDVDGFNEYTQRFKRLLEVERVATEQI